MFPILNIGPLSVAAPGLILLLGTWIGLTLAERLAPRFNVESKTLSDIIFVALVAGIIGARLSYAAQSIQAFLENPLSLVSLTPGMFDPLGGFVIAAAAAFFYGKRKKLPLGPTLDALTPFLAVLVIALGFSHLSSGDAFGTPTDLPWGIFLWKAQRHPTQIYEILAGIMSLGFVWTQAGKSSKGEGRTFAAFTAFNAGAQLFIHGFRGDSTIIANGFRLEQVIALVILGISLWWLGRFNKDAETQDG